MGICQRFYPVEISPRSFQKTSFICVKIAAFETGKPITIDGKTPVNPQKKAICLRIFSGAKQRTADPAVLMSEVEDELAGF